jgi:hypothetical protein
MAVRFSPPPTASANGAQHHGEAAAGNRAAADAAIEALRSALSGAPIERVLLRAAAGAGKSYALARMVGDALQQSTCSRVGVTAFANKQLFPLAAALGGQLGRDQVCLYVSKDRFADVTPDAIASATVVCDMASVPASATVLLCTSHMFGGVGRRLQTQLGTAANGKTLFDVLFVDEAWQLPLHRYQTVVGLAPISVGVGDVGQLPPLDPSQNPWRGDSGYNPYRAWPTAYADDANTWSKELPAVWRPTAAQLPLWRAFYGEWNELNCVAAPGDRTIDLGPMPSVPASIWSQVATGQPTLVEIEGLDEAEAADIDMPLLEVVEQWLDDLLTAGFVSHEKTYDADGNPDGTKPLDVRCKTGSTGIAVLATRNQAVDDAQAMVDRLLKKHHLPQGAVIASTVDSWQGQTNTITVAIHPLSGASRLDEFNSAFGRLAVTCTRATHALLLVSRAGLDPLLDAAAARPGTPIGEPGLRQLPRQTHRRILDTFARGVVDISL